MNNMHTQPSYIICNYIRKLKHNIFDYYEVYPHEYKICDNILSLKHVNYDICHNENQQ